MKIHENKSRERKLLFPFALLAVSLFASLLFASVPLRPQAPPAAPAGPPPSIEVGQTIDQVTASLGQPQKVVNLGTKKIYVYKDSKITFKDGKVSDVQ